MTLQIGAANPFPVTGATIVSGTMAATQSGLWSVSVTGTPNVKIANSPSLLLGGTPSVNTEITGIPNVAESPQVQIGNSSSSLLLTRAAEGLGIRRAGRDATAGRGRRHLAALFIVGVILAGAQDQSDEARRLNNGAASLYAEGKLEAAEQLYLGALAMSANNPVQAAAIANNLGALYKRLNRYGEAERMYQRALDLRRGALPSVRPEIADSMNNLAEVYRLEGRYREALNLTETAVKALEQADARSPDMPVFLNNLAGLERAVLHLDIAEQLGRQAWSLAEKSGEPLKLALVMNTLAQVLADKREYQEAEFLYRRASTIFEGAGPDSSYYLAVTITNLGRMQTMMGQVKEGRESEIQALTLVTGNPVPDNLLRATILHNLGNAAVAEKHFSEAVGYYEQALGWRERVLGREHPANAGLLFDYAAAAGSAGERALAHQLRQRAKQLWAQQKSSAWSRYTVDAGAFAHSR